MTLSRARLGVNAASSIIGKRKRALWSITSSASAESQCETGIAFSHITMVSTSKAGSTRIAGRKVICSGEFFSGDWPSQPKRGGSSQPVGMNELGDNRELKELLQT